MNNNIPYDLYALNWTSLAYHSLARFKQIVRDDNMLPADVCEQIEEHIIPALEYLDGWEPTDAMIQDHIDSRGMF
jgi:hypothetical protein